MLESHSIAIWIFPNLYKSEIEIEKVSINIKSEDIAFSKATRFIQK